MYLQVVSMNPRKKPDFRRWLSERIKRLKPAWRRPRGMHSKIRIRKKSKIKMPNIGWGAPKNLRYLHPSGFKEVLVHNPKDLEKIDPKTQAARIASSVGKKKRQEILKKAEELKIKVLNP
ncbi:MAG: 50S ribosomal protein L32e [Candidatus Aenigmatarchaeota archaeon]